MFPHPAPLLREYNLHAGKRRGQNYLNNPALAQAIVQAAAISREDTVVEIGAGLGALTLALARQAGEVVALEIDRGIYQLLCRAVASFPNVRPLLADALTFNWQELPAPLKIVGNLPYSISSPLLFCLLENIGRWHSATLMLQKEMGLRAGAEPGSRAYSRLSVILGNFCQVKHHFRVGPENFFPRPAVESLLLSLSPRECPPASREEYAWFSQVVRAVFASRRKTLLNSLSAALALDKNLLAPCLQEAGFEPNCRGETLTVEELARLARSLRS
jgi:16S rRNA (adenine1518-N6/adenine1519-N6)-dimethyltransferase